MRLYAHRSIRQRAACWQLRKLIFRGPGVLQPLLPGRASQLMPSSSEQASCAASLGFGTSSSLRVLHHGVFGVKIVWLQRNCCESVFRWVHLKDLYVASNQHLLAGSDMIALIDGVACAETADLLPRDKLQILGRSTACCPADGAAC